MGKKGSTNLTVLFMVLVFAGALFLEFSSTPAGAAATGSTNFTVSGSKILLNGKRLFVKGVDYSPTPAGAGPGNKPFSDYYWPAWKDRWQWDLNKMRSMGINCVRLYGMQTYYDHTAFLDYAWNKGHNPIYVFLPYWFGSGIMDQPQTDRDNIKDGFTQLAKKYGGHPAVIGYILVNEVISASTCGNSAYFQFIHDLGKAVHDDSKDKKLTLIAETDSMTACPNAAQCADCSYSGTSCTNNPVEAYFFPENEQNMSEIDIIGINSYRGAMNTGFDCLFAQIKQRTDKPFLITEYGCPADKHAGDTYDGKPAELENNAAAQGTFIEAHWNDIVKNSEVASGGFIFAWSDEWWKSDHVTVHNSKYEGNGDQSRSDNFPGHFWDDEWFGLFSIAPGAGRSIDHAFNADGSPVLPVDVLTPRAAVQNVTNMFHKPIAGIEAIAGVPAPAEESVMVSSGESFYPVTLSIAIDPGAYAGVNMDFQIACLTPFGTFTYNPDEDTWRSLAEGEEPYEYMHVLIKTYNLHIFSGYLPAGTYELSLKMDMIKDQHHEYPEMEQVSETFTVPLSR